MTNKTAPWLLPHLSANAILERLSRAAGKEVQSGKIGNPESSAALVANTFGYFMSAPQELPALPGWQAGWVPISVLIEEQVRFPWRGGLHPWLDTVIETHTHLVGIESKRYEPYRGGVRAEFSEAYSRNVWGTQMAPYESLRDSLKQRPEEFRFVDAAQLVKHAFGLRTQAVKKGKKPVLAYLYAEPRAWPDTKPILEKQRAAHSLEIRSFAKSVDGAEVSFTHITYQSLLAALDASRVSGVRDHAKALRARFDC
jgi:hypothetical protein